MTVEAAAARPDHNSLGKASFIVGIISLVMAFIPIIGFMSWIGAPVAILFGIVALRKPPRSFAIAGLVVGGFALLVCFWWLSLAEGMGRALNSDTFNTSGEVADMSQAPIMDATIRGVWADMEANRVAAGQRYGGHRLRFSNETIHDFGGDAQSPSIVFEGPQEGYLVHLVSAQFASADGANIAALRKEQQVSFTCETIREGFGGGYSLSGCSLDAAPGEG